MSNQPPPRERGLKPTHFIDVWDAGEDDLYYGSNPRTDCNANNPDIQPIQELNIWVNKHTVAIFKIYPKVEFNVRQLPPITNTSLFWVTIKTTH